MSIFVEDNQYANEVKAQLELIAYLNVFGRFQIFLPSHAVAGGDAASNMYFRVDYASATDSIDLGAQLLKKLANHLSNHIFIHGVSHGFWWTNSKRTESLSILTTGGGLTTDEKSHPHVDLYIDGSKDTSQYTIKAKGVGFIPMRDPFVRLYHELLHAEGLIFGQDHGHWTVIPKTNDFCRQRKLGYEIVLPPADWLWGKVPSL